MMRVSLGLLAIVGMALAAPPRERRQAGCLSSFQNVPNVCSHNPNGQTFFPHPTDPTKFLQCDIYNRMYIIQCPEGEVFQLLTTSCQPAQQPITSLPAVTTQPPVTTKAPVITTKAPVITTKAPVITTKAPVITTKAPVVTTKAPVFTTKAPATTAVGSNPCSPQNIAWGQLYFPYPVDRTKYYECDLQGQPSVVACPSMMLWDQTILSCVYPMSPSSGQTNPTPQFLPGQQNNPCTPKAISEGRFFFPHMDNTKFIQCDMSRNAYVNSCPPKLVWNAFLETCYSPVPRVPSGRK